MNDSTDKYTEENEEKSVDEGEMQVSSHEASRAPSGPWRGEGERQRSHCACKESLVAVVPIP